jgi:hypothetical protein
MERFIFPDPASYTLTNEEKRAICKCPCGIRVPTGFSTNIKNLTSMSELKMNGYNTHNCLVMLSVFLAIAIREINHQYVKMVITRICHFFNAISKKVIGVLHWMSHIKKCEGLCASLRCAFLHSSLI